MGQDKKRLRRISKRSGRVTLTTMAAITSSAMLGACGEESPEAKVAPKVAEKTTNSENINVYENVFECAAKTDLTREQCLEKRNEAVKAGAKEAPRYAALEDCEAEHGAGHCMEAEKSEASRGRSHFSPFLAAFFWRKVNGGEGRPLFKSPAGGFQTSKGMRLGYAGSRGKYYAAARAFEKPRTVSKVRPASKMARSGGFGERARGLRLSDRSDGTSSKGKTFSSRGG